MRSKTTGRIFMKPSNERELKRWRTVVAAAARPAMAGREPLREPLRVLMLAALPMPAAAARRVYPHVPPDSDKLARSVLDALSGVVFRDDALVCDLQVRKRYAGRPGSLATPGVRVTVTPMPAAPLTT